MTTGSTLRNCKRLKAGYCTEDFTNLLQRRNTIDYVIDSERRVDGGESIELVEKGTHDLPTNNVAT